MLIGVSRYCKLATLPSHAASWCRPSGNAPHSGHAYKELPDSSIATNV
jgi:hypothetical protein